MQTILKCSNVFKKIGKNHIINGISFEVNSGEVLGLVGINGSGKSTLIKCIVGLLPLTSGEVYINDYSVKKSFTDAIKNVGAVIENPDFYSFLSGYENLRLVQNIYSGLTDEDLEKIIYLVGLENKITDKVSSYSLGMKQRLGIARAILTKPKILILDEPTNGLDPKGMYDLKKLIKDLSKKGIGIIISSHNLSDLEEICTKVSMIESGKIIKTVDINEIKKLNISLEDSFLNIAGNI